MQWLAVQDFWRYLEAVFSNPVTAKELPQEFARFARVDKSYMKMTKRAHDTKNVLQVRTTNLCFLAQYPDNVRAKFLFSLVSYDFIDFSGGQFNIEMNKMYIACVFGTRNLQFHIILPFLYIISINTVYVDRC